MLPVDKIDTCRDGTVAKMASHIIYLSALCLFRCAHTHA